MNRDNTTQEDITTTTGLTDEDFDDMPVYDGQIVTEGGPNLDVIQKELLKKEWIIEARQIPKEALNLGDATIIDKTIKKEQLTPDELTRLKELLDQYRPALTKLQPEDTLENLKDNIEIVEDEKEFLRLVSEYDTVQTIPFNYKLQGKTIHMTFDVLPITDSISVGQFAENLAFFKDFTEEETRVYDKIQEGQTLSREEMIIQNSLNKKIEKATQENQKEIIVEFLAMQLRFHNKNTSYEEMKEVFNHMHYGYLALLFNKVQEISNLGDVQVENVFQEVNK